MAAALTQMNLRSVRDPEGAVALLGLLGYEARPMQVDARTLVGLDGAAIAIRSDPRNPARGYGVLVIEVGQPLRGARALGRRLLTEFHDRPLALVGLRNGTGWTEFTLVRPRLLAGRAGSVAVARLTVDPRQPTPHDAEVVDGVRWDPARSDADNHRGIDEAFDVERVTKRFFLGLAEHYRALVAAVAEIAGRGGRPAEGIRRAGGPDRVALRIVNQVLFCYFLQRKGLLGGKRDYLRDLYQRHAGADFYAGALEPLFYQALGKPEGERRPEWRGVGVPFLDGGLFECPYGDVSLPIPGELFSTSEGLLGFLDGWTFTVSEDMADDAEVAVDPEMLGKVFENLIGDEEARRQGTVYTPRPVVQFMCREALVPYLTERAGLSEAEARLLVTREEGEDVAAVLGRPGQAALIHRALEDLRVLDPAVGSGAFPLGMLSEIVRLRRMCHLAEAGGREPGWDAVHGWKRHAIEHSLFGVDVNPTAIELFRLRLWLALLVDLPAGRTPEPLPNLEYRAVCADALPDFLAGVEVQQTRAGSPTFAFGAVDPGELQHLRNLYFETPNPAGKATLRREIEECEDELLEQVFRRALEEADAQAASRRGAVRDSGERARVDVERLKGLFHSADRVFPLFLPAFHAPEVVARGNGGEGGWDVVIMNPPYVGRNKARPRIDGTRLADYERHYGRTFDLMIHFAFRALELVRPGGVVSMIFNDSIFTSRDAEELRRALFGEPYQGRRAAVRVAARTRCFEGKAVNGGVVVAVRDGELGELRWIENHGRPTTDLLAASGPDPQQRPGESELFVVPAAELLRLPHRPLFRPSPEALKGLEAFERCAFWGELSRSSAPRREEADWAMLSEAPRLERWKRRAEREGRLRGLRPGRDFVLLGLVVDGGQGLATADDRRFLAALDGTPEAEKARANAERYESALTGGPARDYQELRRAGRTREEALLALAERYSLKKLGWPKSGLIRVADPGRVRRTPLTEQELQEGIASGPCFVPFEKGDTSDGGRGARWRRENPLVIDWSREAVGLLRARAQGPERHRKPRFQNERLWGRGGVTWNSVASYLGARLVPDGSIFGDMAPTVTPTADWLSVEALLALLNADAVEFLLRTFLGSRMMIEIGDVRRVPVPVLSDRDADDLTGLGRAAVAAKERFDAGGPREPLEEIEREINERVRALYGFARDDELWVMR